MSHLDVSEHFYSLQGEGVTSGVPAVFLRLQGCNLLCGGKGTQHDGRLHDGATWRCDTVEVWAKGTRYETHQLLELFAACGYTARLNAGAHLVVTGGEPCLQQEGLVAFLGALRPRVPNLYVEVETNGTITPTDALLAYVNQINCSPKLANSGMKPQARVRREGIERISQLDNAFFKFVVTCDSDVEEVERTFVHPFGIDPRRVLLMPGAGSREELTSRLGFLAAACIEKGYRLSSRLQLEIWDQTTGV